MSRIHFTATTLAVGAIGWRRCALCGAVAERISHVVERPTRRRIVTFVGLLGVAAPAFTGVLDLALRARTP